MGATGVYSWGGVKKKKGGAGAKVSSEGEWQNKQAKCRLTKWAGGENRGGEQLKMERWLLQGNEGSW